MCEYALRKHSESTGRVPRRLAQCIHFLNVLWYWRSSRRLAGRNAKRERAAREGARQLWIARSEFRENFLYIERASRRARVRPLRWYLV